MSAAADLAAADLAAVWPELLALACAARRLRAAATRTGIEDIGGQRALDAALDDLAGRTADPLLAAVYAPLVARIARGPLTIAQLGQSLDGRIATESGHSHYINGAASLDHLHRLRALVDGVVVGAGTVAADDPHLTTRRVPGPHPVRVVLDPRRRLSRARRVFDDAAPTLTIVAAAVGAAVGDSDEDAIVVAADDGHVAPARVLAALHRRGLHTILVEGGARTVSAFLASGLIDRLHVMVAPLVIGSGSFGLRLPAVARIDDALRLRAGVHRLGDDVLFDCEPAAPPR